MTNYKLTKRKIVHFSLVALACLLLVSVAYGGSRSVSKAMLNKTADLINCQAVFDSENYTGPNPSMGGISFLNFSEGDFEHLSWDFGDGAFSSSTDNVVDHFYTNSGTYQVSLNIWNDDLSCYDVATKQVTVLVSNNPCDLSPCVLPGDANNDGKADLYDLMHIGMGFGMTGPVRNSDPDAWKEWTPQPAEDWDLETGDGVNYKHLDTDGNGEINYQDMSPLLYHYTPMVETVVIPENSGPRVFLDFDVDTIFINEDTESLVSVSAGLVLGNFNNPMENVHGVSLFLDYDTTLTDVSSGVLVNYNPNSFMGSLDEVFPYGNDLREHNQIDIGISRINNISASGFGRIATIDFIIIIDIIDGRAEKIIPFDVDIQGIKVLDKEGNLIEVNLDEIAAQVIFVKETATGIGPTNSLEKQVQVYPNPVKNGSVTIDLKDLNGESIQFYNTLGQLLKSTTISGNKANILVSDLPKGVYQLHIQTEEGMVAKRLLVE